jgi:hypothetical protein
MTETHQHVMVLAGLVLVLGGSAAMGNPVPEPRPVPIASEQEVLTSIAEGKYSERYDGRATLSILWDGRLPLLTDALASEHQDVRREAMIALGNIGSHRAVAALRSVLADTSAQLEDLMTGANSLAWAGDTSSIPLIESIAQRLAVRRSQLGDTREGAIMGAHVEILRGAVRRLERPDLRRPLIVRDGHFVRYRFLLDDISSIAVCGYPPDDPIHTFAAAEYRTICDLLQDGYFVEPGMVTEEEYLVFELSDGRSIRLVRDGVNFCRSGGSWDRGDPGFCVASESLARYVDGQLGRPDVSGGAGDAPSAESSN